MEEEADMKVAEEEKVWLRAMVEGQVMSMLMLPKIMSYLLIVNSL